MTPEATVELLLALEPAPRCAGMTAEMLAPRPSAIVNTADVVTRGRRA